MIHTVQHDINQVNHIYCICDWVVAKSNYAGSEKVSVLVRFMVKKHPPTEGFPC